MNDNKYNGGLRQEYKEKYLLVQMKKCKKEKNSFLLILTPDISFIGHIISECFLRIFLQEIFMEFLIFVV